MIVEQLELDVQCWSCAAGARNPSLTNPDGSCEVCDGVGYTVTNQGQTVLDFIARHTGGEK